MTIEKLLYAPEDAARLLAISRSTVYNLMNDGKLKSIHIGRSRRIHIEELYRFVKDLEAQPQE